MMRSLLRLRAGNAPDHVAVAAADGRDKTAHGTSHTAPDATPVTAPDLVALCYSDHSPNATPVTAPDLVALRYSDHSPDATPVTAPDFVALRCPYGPPDDGSNFVAHHGTHRRRYAPRDL